MASPPSQDGAPGKTLLVDPERHVDLSETPILDSEGQLAQSKEASEVKRKITGIPWFIVMLALLSSTFLYALDNTITANVRPSILKTFGNRVAMLPWLSVSYPLAEVGSNPLWGKLNNQVDNKTLYLVALLIFEVGSAVIGSAQSIQAVVGGRAIAGFGGSGIYVGTMNIVSAMTTPSERNQYLTFVGVSWSLGTILGPVIGGAFADSSATWRWAFYINICIAALALPASVGLVPRVMPPDAAVTSVSVLHRLKRVDLVGATLFIGGVTSVIMILGFGGALYDWSSGQMIGLYVAVVLIWAIFVIQQRFSLFTKDRIFPVQFLRSLEMNILFCWTAVAISQLVVVIYTLPLFFQFALGLSSLKSAVYIIPFVTAAVASGGALSPMFQKFPITMAWIVTSSILMLIGNGLLTTIDYDTSRGAICGYTVIVGIGCGPVLQLGYTVGQARMPRTATSHVTGFMSCGQMAGLALSLGIATTVFLNIATKQIQIILPGTSREMIQNTINGVNTDLLTSLEPDVRLDVLKAVAHSVGEVFYLNVASAAFGLVSSLLLKRDRVVI